MMAVIRNCKQTARVCLPYLWNKQHENAFHLQNEGMKMRVFSGDPGFSFFKILSLLFDAYSRDNGDAILWRVISRFRLFLLLFCH